MNPMRGNNSPRCIPLWQSPGGDSSNSCLIGKVPIPHLRFFRGLPTGRTVSGSIICSRCHWLEVDGIQKAFPFQILIDVWIGKGGIAAKVAVDLLAAITGDIGSSTACQSLALCTLPSRSSVPSTSPNWLKQNKG